MSLWGSEATAFSHPVIARELSDRSNLGFDFYLSLRGREATVAIAFNIFFFAFILSL